EVWRETVGEEASAAGPKAFCTSPLRTWVSRWKRLAEGRERVMSALRLVIETGAARGSVVETMTDSLRLRTSRGPVKRRTTISASRVARVMARALLIEIWPMS